jgi:diguanylate cyclase (GGDEF)-like protein
VLGQVAERIREVVRSADVPCRVGGDEFAVILPEATMQDAEQLSARIQSQLAARPISGLGPIQVSAGVAELREHDDSVAFFQRADEALYTAKGAGKSRIVVAPSAAGHPGRDGSPQPLPWPSGVEREER